MPPNYSPASRLPIAGVVVARASLRQGDSIGGALREFIVALSRKRMFLTVMKSFQSRLECSVEYRYCVEDEALFIKLIEWLNVN